MRALTLALTLTLFTTSAFASDTTLVFTADAYDQLFEKAKAGNKGIMLYFHFDGCGACMKMEKTAFRDPAVIDYFAANMISYEVNTRTDKGGEVNEEYAVQLHPTFLFLDHTGREVHRMVGVFEPEEFLRQARAAYEDNRNLAAYKEQYKAGNRDPGFLFEYAYMLRDASGLDSTVVNEYLDAIDPSEYAHEKNIRFIYEFCVHGFKVCIPFGNPRFDFLLNNRSLFSQYVDSSQVDTRIVWILSSAIYTAIEEKDQSTFERALRILEEFDTGKEYVYREMDGRITGIITSKHLVLSARLLYYQKMGDREQYLSTLDAYMTAMWDDAEALNSYAWSVYEQEDDPQTIEAAIACSARSIELENNYANNDTYSWLLYKAGEKELALEQAQATIRIAQESGVDYTETQKLVDMIEGKK